MTEATTTAASDTANHRLHVAQRVHYCCDVRSDLLITRLVVTQAVLLAVPRPVAMTASRRYAVAGMLLLLMTWSCLSLAASASASASASVHAGPQRRLSQASASASASANARQGESVTAVSRATSDGAPASSDVRAAGSGPGTVVDCRAAAESGQAVTKECGGTNGGGGSGGNVPWEAARACPRPASAYRVVRDLSGRPWGWENGASCALRGPDGKPTA